MIDYAKNFTLYINEFNHTHRFSKEFLNEILKQITILQSNINDRHQQIAEIGKMMSDIISNLQPIIYINMPLLWCISSDVQVQVKVTLSLHANRLKQYIVDVCGAKEQVFLDKDVVNTKLSFEQINALTSIIFELLTEGNDIVVEDICEQLLQTNTGKQNITDMYKLLQQYFEPDVEEDVDALQVVFPYAQKALATDNITVDDIKDLFDI